MNRRSGSQVIRAAAGAILATFLAAEAAHVTAQGGVYKSGVELVPLTVTVTDRAGRYVPDLTAADFAIFEEGQPQVIAQFAAARRRSTSAFSSTPAAACRTPFPWRRRRLAGWCGSFARAIARRSPASRRPSWFISR
jgi:hypothetical protein